MAKPDARNATLPGITEGKVEENLPPPLWSRRNSLAASITDFCSDCDVTPERRRRAKREKGSSILTQEELLSLQQLQHDIATETGNYSRGSIVRHAEEGEEKRSHVDALHKKVLQAKRRARARGGGDNALGVLPQAQSHVRNSLFVNPFAGGAPPTDENACHDTLFKRRCDAVHMAVAECGFDAEDCSYVRKPCLDKLLKARRQQQRPKISLRNILTSRRFILYKHRFANCQREKALFYPTLPQPKEDMEEGDGSASPTEKTRSRSAHRFVIAADTQFGIIMDGRAMDNPNWNAEIEISRRAVEQINAMKAAQRPLFVCVCGDLVDTEASFNQALASWKKVMKGWERTLVYEQQVKDFKQVWSRLDDDIALVCLCGNHDVGNRPTPQSIQTWTSAFGSDYLAFWVNGTYNIALNNCIFSDPTGAPEMFEEQLSWLEQRLIYAKENKATHVFVFSHFPWFLEHEDETDKDVSSFSGAPVGWGPEGTKFPDNYFTIPFEYRQMALLLFKEYGVTACFSGHFHQNVIAKASWGMDMIVTGPLSMTLTSTIHEKLSNEPHGLGMGVVDVKEGGFSHKFVLLDE